MVRTRSPVQIRLAAPFMRDIEIFSRFSAFLFPCVRTPVSGNKTGNAGRKRRYAAGTRPKILRLFFVLAVYVRCFDRIVARARPSGMAQVRRRRRGAGEPILYSSVLAYNVVLSFVKLIPCFADLPRVLKGGEKVLSAKSSASKRLPKATRPRRFIIRSPKAGTGKSREDESGGGGI